MTTEHPDLTELRRLAPIIAAGDTARRQRTDLFRVHTKARKRAANPRAYRPSRNELADAAGVDPSLVSLALNPRKGERGHRAFIARKKGQI